MDRYEDLCDDCGQSFRHYYWVQGDTFKNRLAVKNSDGSLVGNDVIQSIEFRLLDADKNVEYSQNYEYNSSEQKWDIVIPSQETMKWAVDTHYYRYVLTYVDGSVITARKNGLFTVEK